MVSVSTVTASSSLTFDCFPAGCIKFLNALSKHNDREWFQPRKQEFDELVHAPMLQFAGRLNQMLGKDAPEYSFLDPKKSLNRIYRDIRFSPDKTPYNSHVSCYFPSQKLGKKEGAGLYFHLSGKEAMLAAGLYFGETSALQAVREHIAERHTEFLKILGAKALRETFGELQGDALRKTPKQFGPDHPASDLLKRKQWLMHKQWPAAKATEPGFAQEALGKFRLLIPFVRFLNSPLEAKAREATW